VRAALSGWNTQDLVRWYDDATSHTQLLSALRAGPAVVDYQGHGTEDTWNGRILTSDDVDALSNSGKTSLMVAATCLNAYFHDIGRETLGTALLRTPAGGAWSMWASSGMTFPTEHATLSSALFTAALDDALTLGEATLKAKQAVQDVDVRATFQLLGDPSARAVAAKSPAVTTPTPKPAANSSGCGTPVSPSVVVAMLALIGLAMAVRRRRPSV
jgi:MYXO-CTERM domain-containing protein